ncbi:DUF1566 domain-containing protein [Aliarcobacter cryaerophilus]|uniref:Lcl domain-containing protein n=1 Tax=Aliarcobacter cryaerophilus TaxID=28198 RepID=UPI003DA51E55
MRGKILFFSEEKGFGKIIDSGKNEYFFYINKIKNKPEEINKDDEVEFEYYESPKGLRATNIYFFEKIECPICNTLNYENDKNCKNIKCNWDLKYVKNGSFIGLSYKEIEEYNIKLRDYKNVYFDSLNNLYSTNSQINSKPNMSYLTGIENGKIIQGKIIYYSQISGGGVILGEDTIHYPFLISDTDEPSRIQKDILVNFSYIHPFAKNIKIKHIPIKQIIQGKITYCDQISGFGYILGEDTRSYTFLISDTDEPSRIQKDILVNFTKNEYPFAKNIKIKNIEKHTKHNLNTKIDKYDSNNDDLYIDREELLMWKTTPFKKMRWNDAMNFTSDLLYAKHEDWRLPTANELIGFFISQKNWNIYRDYLGDYHYKFELKTFENFWTSSDISKRKALVVYFYTEGYLSDAWFDLDFDEISGEISGIDFDADSIRYPKEDKFSFFCVRDI